MHIVKKNVVCIYWFKLFYCCCELNTGVAVGFAGYKKAVGSDGIRHEMYDT